MNDDHNRYRIATEHGLTYETVQKDFESREHVLNWIISNQLGRRNLNPNQIAYLRGRRYENEKKLVSNEKGVNKSTYLVNGQNDHQPKTAQNQREFKSSSMPNANLKDKPKTYDVIAEEMKVLRKTNQPYIL